MMPMEAEALGFIIFVIAGVAETRRLPFDPPEAGQLLTLHLLRLLRGCLPDLRDPAHARFRDERVRAAQHGL
jgi:hypothetical protein